VVCFDEAGRGLTGQQQAPVDRGAGPDVLAGELGIGPVAGAVQVAGGQALQCGVPLQVATLRHQRAGGQPLVDEVQVGRRAALLVRSVG
jgi:hypothetical protein